MAPVDLELLADLLERVAGRLQDRGSLLGDGDQGRLPHLTGPELQQRVRHLGGLRVGADEPVQVAGRLFEQFEELDESLVEPGPTTVSTCWAFVKLSGDVALTPLYESVVVPEPTAVNDWTSGAKVRAEVAFTPLYESVTSDRPHPCLTPPLN